MKSVQNSNKYVQIYQPCNIAQFNAPPPPKKKKKKKKNNNNKKKSSPVTSNVYTDFGASSL